jgi:hypothetical protein
MLGVQRRGSATAPRDGPRGHPSPPERKLDLGRPRDVHVPARGCRSRTPYAEVDALRMQDLQNSEGLGHLERAWFGNMIPVTDPYPLRFVRDVPDHDFRRGESLRWSAGCGARSASTARSRACLPAWPARVLRSAWAPLEPELTGEASRTERPKAMLCNSLVRTVPSKIRDCIILSAVLWRGRSLELRHTCPGPLRIV